MQHRPDTLALRQQYLLCFLAADEALLDPIRIMKGMFIFTQEAPIDWTAGRSLYDFKPYHYGPFASDIYADLDVLRSEGFITATEKPGQTWKYYQATEAGAAAAADLRVVLHGPALRYLAALRQFVASLNFHSLLRAVYKKYPRFAVNSVFKYS